MQTYDWKTHEEASTYLLNAILDHHVLVIPANQDEYSFEYFSCKDIDQVKYDELKQLVENKCKEFKNDSK